MSDWSCVVEGPLELAGELVSLGAQIVVFGSTARRLRTGEGAPRDLDVVVPERSLPSLVHALGQLDVEGADTLLRCRPSTTLHTGWCPLDVFLSEHPRSAGIASGSTVVQVLV